MPNADNSEEDTAGFELVDQLEEQPFDLINA
jgi:hypothetical protein